MSMENSASIVGSFASPIDDRYFEDTSLVPFILETAADADLQLETRLEAGRSAGPAGEHAR